jgi:fatty acid desaturase
LSVWCFLFVGACWAGWGFGWALWVFPVFVWGVLSLFVEYLYGCRKSFRDKPERTTAPSPWSRKGEGTTIVFTLPISESDKHPD